MKKMVILLVMVSLIMASGCTTLNPATPFKGSQVLINPSTKEEAVCRYNYFAEFGGLRGGLLPGNLEFNKCIKGYESVGFVKMGTDSIRECKVRSRDICDQQIQDGTIDRSSFRECQENAYHLCLEQWTP